MREPRHATAPGHRWTRPITVSEHELVRGFAGVVPPVLAGFSLATIAGLVTADDPPALALWAVAGLVVTAFAMIYAMQFLFTALRYWSTPADRLAWRPEAAESEDALREERWYHALDQALFTLYSRRGRAWYNTGIAAFAVSVLLLVIPGGAAVAPDLATWVVVSVAALGVLGELTLLVGAYVPALQPLVWPDPHQVSESVAASFKP
jgi:hypothetical protein